MVQLLLWMVMAYGMSNILVYGSIFNGVRNWIHKNAEPNIGWVLFRPIFVFLSGLIQCMMCTSTWVGFLYGSLLYSPVHELLGASNYYSWFFDGMLASGAVWAINGIIEWFELNRPNNN